MTSFSGNLYNVKGNLYKSLHYHLAVSAGQPSSVSWMMIRHFLTCNQEGWFCNTICWLSLQ
ncbi:hypothetical protein AR543_21055 [Paenibacillus bovis]|uniref:Uncharacterized protein n=1 Tax=Paenibacillus bovis TaxID=1616788 RepID=A0A172ZKT4_9BACL|nr:hypothetical protein AR543_21055 [Paenibacillus bovis]